MSEKISLIGLGKLGLPMAACFSAKGFETLAVDVNADLVKKINRGNIPFFEPGLTEMFKRGQKRLEASTAVELAIQETDITFIIVPTPSSKSGEFSNAFLKKAIRTLSLALRKTNKKYHLFVISSTVMPQTSEKVFIPMIERISGRKINTGFGICYNPEFIALGSVIKNFLNPDMVLIGESDIHAGEILERFYKKILENKAPVIRMSLTSAEITKISLNSFVTMKISFANQLMQICQSVPNADIDVITQALGFDRRIGSQYLKSGVSFGGPCFPRDNRAFSVFAENQGVSAPLARATDMINEKQTRNLAQLILTYAKKGEAILVIGVAYKENTAVIEESAIVKAIKKLLVEGVRVIVYDPLAGENIRKVFGDKIMLASSVTEYLNDVSLCVLALPYKETREHLQRYRFNSHMVIIDCWRVLDVSKINNIEYVPFGKITSKKDVKKSQKNVS